MWNREIQPSESTLVALPVSNGANPAYKQMERRKNGMIYKKTFWELQIYFSSLLYRRFASRNRKKNREEKGG